MNASIVVAVLWLGALHLVAQPNDSAAKSQSIPQKAAPATTATQASNKSATQTKTADSNSPHWYTSSEWWLVLIAALTGIAIAYQAREMTRATEAMRDQIRHAINTERAWILVEIGELPSFEPDPNRLEFLWIRPTFKNCGNTMARIKAIRAVVRLVADGEKLPQRPEYPLGQGADVKGIDLMLTPNFPIQPIKLGITGDEFSEVRRATKFFYIHGFIEYLDMSKIERRTAFCFYYAVRSGFSRDPTRFYLELTAPAGYNEFT